MKKSITIIKCVTFIFVLSIIIYSCSPKLSVIKQELEETTNDLNMSFEKGESSAKFYAEDSKIIVTDNPHIIKGVKSIDEYYKTIKEMGVDRMPLELVSIKHSGNLVIAEYKYKVFVSGNIIHEGGDVYFVFEKIEGKWIIIHQVAVKNE